MSSRVQEAPQMKEIVKEAEAQQILIKMWRSVGETCVVCEASHE